MFTSSSTNSSREFSLPDSPSSQPPHPQAFPPPQRRKRHQSSNSTSISLTHPNPRYRRFYSSPVHEGSPSTPLQVYGLEQREPSICGDKPKLLRRFSHALDDIKEDFSLQLDPRTTADKIKRRSTLMLDGFAAPSNASSDGSEPRSPEPEPSSRRPNSILSFENWTPPRRLSRRLTMTFSQRRKRLNQGASISQPNLIGSTMQV